MYGWMIGESFIGVSRAWVFGVGTGWLGRISEKLAAGKYADCNTTPCHHALYLGPFLLKSSDSCCDFL
jgi:hypothetical protein